MSEEELRKRALEFHAKLRGKLEVHPKLKLSRENLRLCYTPGVAYPAQLIAENPLELDKLTWRGNTVAIVSDGTAVLGLGNIGPEAALPVMEGKAVIFKELANIDAVPLCIEAETAEKLAEFIKAIQPSFAGINLEDVHAPKCFEVEELVEEQLRIPLFHDDQHGTAVVVLAALYNALKVRDWRLSEVKVVINGVGAAGTAIAKLLIEAGVGKLVLVDRNGILNPYEPETCLHRYHLELAERVNPEGVSGDLEQALRGSHVFIGVSRAGLLKPEYIRFMAEKPIVFALANPVPEIEPHLAYEAGAWIVATGRSDYPNQVNNLLGFPGIFRGLLEVRARKISVKMKLMAARAIAESIIPDRYSILPSPLDRRVVINVAFAVARQAISEGLAELYIDEGELRDRIETEVLQAERSES